MTGQRKLVVMKHLDDGAFLFQEKGIIKLVAYQQKKDGKNSRQGGEAEVRSFISRKNGTGKLFSENGKVWYFAF